VPAVLVVLLWQHACFKSSHIPNSCLPHGLTASDDKLQAGPYHNDAAQKIT
jgi:hypothetical protein